MKRVAILAALLTVAALAELHVPAVAALAAAQSKPQPEYHPLARRLHVTGDVSVEVRIAVGGDVSGVKLLAGNALLANTVLKTVKTWRFKPFLSEGHPTVAVTILHFSFK